MFNGFPEVNPDNETQVQFLKIKYMKTEKNQSKMKTGGVGVSTVVTAFVTGAATGFAVGAFLNSKKSNGLKDKLKNLIADFSGGPGSSEFPAEIKEFDERK